MREPSFARHALYLLLCLWYDEFYIILRLWLVISCNEENYVIFVMIVQKSRKIRRDTARYTYQRVWRGVKSSVVWCYPTALTWEYVTMAGSIEIPLRDTDEVNMPFLIISLIHEIFNEMILTVMELGELWETSNLCDIQRETSMQI